MYLDIDVESMLIRGILTFEGLSSARRNDFARTLCRCNKIYIYFHSVESTKLDPDFLSLLRVIPLQ